MVFNTCQCCRKVYQPDSGMSIYCSPQCATEMLNKPPVSYSKTEGKPMDRTNIVIQLSRLSGEIGGLAIGLEYEFDAEIVRERMCNIADKLDHIADEVMPEVACSKMETTTIEPLLEYLEQDHNCIFLESHISEIRRIVENIK